MKLSLIGLVLLLGLGVLGWWVSGSDAGGARADGAGESAAAAASPGVSHPKAGSTSRHALRELAGAAPDSQPDDAERDRATLRGRCVSAETGEPLAGMRVEFRGFPRSEELAWIHGRTHWDDPAPIVTGADGRFEFRFAVLAWFRHALEISGEGLIARDGYFPAFSPRQVTDLGDLALERGFAVSGFVKDEEGRPVAGVPIFVRGDYAKGRLDTGPNSGSFVREGKSGPGGAFVIASFLPAGRWLLDVQGFGRDGPPCHEFERTSPKYIEGEAGIGAIDVPVIVRRRLSIEGTVTEEGGAPVQELSLLATGDGGTYGMGHAKDGEFRLFLLGGKPGPVRIGWGHDGKSDYEVFKTVTRFEWGVRGVRLSAKRFGFLELEVVEAGTGLPVAEFAVKRSRLTGESDRQRSGSLVYSGRSPRGRRRLDRVLPGELFLEVVPRRPDLLASRPLRVIVTGTRAPVRIELERATSFTVRVLHPDRSPVPGASVELIDCHEHGRVTHDSAIADERRSFTTEGSIQTADHDGVLTLSSRETTGADGRARLFGSRLVPRLALRVLGVGHRPEIREDFGLPAAGGEVTVVLSPGAGIDVTVRPASIGRLHGAGFALRRPGDHGTLPKLEGFSFEKDGKAQARGIPSGAWEVLFVHSGDRLEPPLTAVELKEGEIHRLELELPHLAPARLAGKILWMGGRCPSGSVTLNARIQGRRVRARVVLDTSGSFVAEGLFPGRYQVSASLRTTEGVGGVVRVAHAEFVELLPHADLTLVFELTPRVLRLRLLHHDGEPAASQSGALDGESMRTWFVTDARGEALVTPVPGPEVTVMIGRDQLSRRVFVPPDREPELTIQLPPWAKK